MLADFLFSLKSILSAFICARLRHLRSLIQTGYIVQLLYCIVVNLFIINNLYDVVDQRAQISFKTSENLFKTSL